MKKNTNSFKTLYIVILLISFSSKIYCQEADIWSGDFILKSLKFVPLDTIRIQKIIDVNKDMVAYNYKIDLKRWVITSKNNNFKDKIVARRFLFDTLNDENEYEEFNWTELYLKGEMKCIDAGRFFICQTIPNSNVKLGDEESFFTRTGVFGIRLHYGFFTLERLLKN